MERVNSPISFLLLVVVAVGLSVKCVLAEDPFEVSLASYTEGSTSEIGKCLAVNNFKVRFHSLKMSDGTEFIKHSVTDRDMACFTDSRNESFQVANIKDCLTAVADSGLNAFSFDAGSCTGYLDWRPPQYQSCTGGNNVVYVAKTFSANFQPPPSQISLNFTHGLSSLVVTWNITNVCYVTIEEESVRLSWNGTDYFAENTQSEFKFTDPIFCSNLTNLTDHPQIFTVEVMGLDGSGAETGLSASEELQNKTLSVGERTLLQTNNCIYYTDTITMTHSSLEKFCADEFHSSYFIARQSTDFKAFAEALYADETDYEFHHIGLRKFGDKWMWDSGLEQPANDSDVWYRTTWDTTDPTKLCAETTAVSSEGKHWLLPIDCDYTQRTLCHEYTS